MIDAVLAMHGDNPYAAQRAADLLQTMVAQPWWSDTFTAYARCARITRNLDTPLTLNPDAYVEEVEHALHQAYLTASQGVDATGLGETLHRLQAPISAFFERVLVNADDETVRKARLALVQHIAQLPATVADLSKLQGF